MERGGSLKSPYLIARCIRLNTNILQGSSANIVGTEPIFVSNAELYSRKHLIINTLHFAQLPQGRLGLWVRAPSGSPKKVFSNEDLFFSKTFTASDAQSVIHSFEAVHKVVTPSKKTRKSDTLGRKKPPRDGFCVTVAVLPISQMCYHYE